jgi:hypothetical protein
MLKRIQRSSFQCEAKYKTPVQVHISLRVAKTALKIRLKCRTVNRLLLTIAVLLCIPAFTELTQACQCREYGTPICAEFWRSDAVFVGQVVDITPLKRKPDNEYTYVMVRFTVQESFRGVSGPTVGVGVATNTLCEPKFKKRKRYLVYASLDEKTNQFFTGMCRRTTLAVDIDESLTELRRLAKREVEESISGRIKTNRLSRCAWDDG